MSTARPKFPNKNRLFKDCRRTGDCTVMGKSIRRQHFSPELRTSFFRYSLEDEALSKNSQVRACRVRIALGGATATKVPVQRSGALYRSKRMFSANANRRYSISAPRTLSKFRSCDVEVLWWCLQLAPKAERDRIPLDAVQECGRRLDDGPKYPPRPDLVRVV